MDYRIAQGDTLSAIALRNGTSIDALVQANAQKITDPNLIIAGDTITIPDGSQQVRGGVATIGAPPVALPVPAPAPAAAPAPTGAGEDHDFERRVVDLVNRERTSRGLQPLAYDAKLDAAAEAHDAQQARTGTMAHEGIGDGSPDSRIRGAGWTGGYGENVAYGQFSPEEVMTTWMNSPGHRAAILRPDFTHLGVAFEKSGTNGLNYWTQNFGAR